MTDKQMMANVARLAVIEYLKDVKREFARLMEAELDEDGKSKSWKVKVPDSKGKYAEYQWLQLDVEDKGKTYIYWLTLFANDYDQLSCNVHTVFGEIQFWKGIIEHMPEGGKTKRLGPNPSIVDLQYPPYGSGEKGSKKYKETKYNVITGEFDSKTIVKEFLKFVEAAERSRPGKNEQTQQE